MDKQLELTRFQTISQQMLGLAETGDWDKIPALESERKQMMYAFFETADLQKKLLPEESEKVAVLIKEVLHINDNISKLAEQGKQHLSQEFQGMKKRQNVQSAYLQNR